MCTLPVAIDKNIKLLYNNLLSKLGNMYIKNRIKKQVNHEKYCYSNSEMDSGGIFFV